MRESLRLGGPAAKVLAARGFAAPDAARRFLNPAFEDLHDALTMRDMSAAIERIARAIRDGERILIYGDYDVDGTTSVVLLTKAIELAGGQAGYHVPHRLKDGYGMRPEVVEAAAEQGVKLIVSVDTGIRAAEVVRRANELGIDVIVTDHHLPESDLPPALAVLNPNRRDCEYVNKDLCGAGVAFKVIQALLPHIGWPADKVRRVSESFLKLAAIATVADVVPLTGENRIIVTHGLRGLGSVRNIGLRALLDVAGFTPEKAAPNARQIAFQIAPRLNAAGRMDTAKAVVELFLTTNAERARELAKQLHEQNAERQSVEAEIRETCEQIVVDPAECALVYYAENWHRGVLGIVASRLVERLHRPVFVLSRNEDGLASGSGRSIPAFHLLDALESMADLFVKFGGHEHAAGVTLEIARVPEFRERFNAYAAKVLCADDFLRRVEIDAVLELAEIHEQSVEELFGLAPFGHGNPAPLFAAVNVEIAGPPAVWKEKHLKVQVRQNGRGLALKAWNFAPRAEELAAGTRVDIAFSLEEDAYSASRGYPGWAAVLREFRKS